MITRGTWNTPTPNHVVGTAVYYAPGVMRATAAYHGLSLEGYVGGVATMSPADQGREVWLNPGTGWEGPFLVVDCSIRGRTWYNVTQVGTVVEVDFETWQRWNGNQRLEVEVAFGPYRPDVPPLDYVDWWESVVEYEPIMTCNPICVMVK